MTLKRLNVSKVSTKNKVRKTEVAKKPSLTVERAKQILDKALEEGLAKKAESKGKQIANKGIITSAAANKDRLRHIKRLIEAGFFAEPAKLNDLSKIKETFHMIKKPSAMSQAIGHIGTFLQHASPADVGMTSGEKDALQKAFESVSKEEIKDYEIPRQKGIKSEKEEKLWIDDWDDFCEQVEKKEEEENNILYNHLSPSQKMVYRYSMYLSHYLCCFFYNIRGLWATVKLYDHPNCNPTKDNYLLFDSFGTMTLFTNNRKNDKYGKMNLSQYIPSAIAKKLHVYILKCRGGSEYLFPGADGRKIVANTYTKKMQDITEEILGKRAGLQIMRKVQITYDFAKNQDMSSDRLERMSRNYHHSLLEHLLYVKKEFQWEDAVDKEEAQVLVEEGEPEQVKVEEQVEAIIEDDMDSDWEDE